MSAKFRKSGEVAGAPPVIDLREGRLERHNIGIIAFRAALSEVACANAAASAVLGLDVPLAGQTARELAVLFDSELMTALVWALSLAAPVSYPYEVVHPDGEQVRTIGRVVVPHGNDRPLIITTWAGDSYEDSYASATRTPALPTGIDDDLVELFAELEDDQLNETLLYIGLDLLDSECGVALTAIDSNDCRIVCTVDIEGSMPFVRDQIRSRDDVDRHFGQGATISAGGTELRFSPGIGRREHFEWVQAVAERVYARRGSRQRDSFPAREPKPAPVIVYVDDDPESVNLLTEYFRLQSSYQLFTASNAAEALELIARVHPQVVLLDAWLGDSSVESLVESLQSAEESSEASIVMLSADASRSTIDRFRALGATAYLSKPLDLVRLTQVIDGLFSEIDLEGGSERACNATALPL